MRSWGTRGAIDLDRIQAVRVLQGDPSQVILDQAQKLSVDLLIVGSHSHGAGADAVPWSAPTVLFEELFLTGQLLRGIGSDNIDWRLRNAQFNVDEGVRWLGTSVASLSELQTAGGGARTRARITPCLHSAFAKRPKKGAQVFALNPRCTTGRCL